MSPPLNPEALEIKLRRRRILEYLGIIYGTPINLGTLHDQILYVDADYDFTRFRKDIKYLADKGYLRLSDEVLSDGMAYRKRIVGLTPDGKELAEGTDTDKALEI